MDENMKRIVASASTVIHDTMDPVISSSSEEDDEPLRKLSKVEDFVEKTVHNYDDQQFKANFRLSRRMADILIDLYENSPYSPKGSCHESPILPEKAILFTLWYLANDNTYRQITELFGIAKGSGHKTLTRVLEFLISLKKRYIFWPDNEEKVEISEAFQNKKNIEGVCGAIDCCHVKIYRPQEHEETYVNRKSYHSLIIQAVVDHNKLFRDVYYGEPGSLHDARVLRRSNLYAKAQDGELFEDRFLLGDSAYPALHWLVPPYKDNGRLTEHQREFNYKVSATRIVVEHAFGMLKMRFRRIFKQLDNSDLGMCVNIILACCILHNFCIINEDDTNIELNYANPEELGFIEMDQEQIQGPMAPINRREQVFRQLFPNGQ